MPFREVFGDDTQDYGAALATHYDDGPPAGLAGRSSAPVRARTHGRTGRKPGRTICTLPTRWRWQPRLGSGCSLGWRARRRCRRRSILIPYQTGGVREIVDPWLPLTFAVNSLNRAMGNRTCTRSCFPPGDRQARLRARGSPRQVIEASAMRPLRADVAIPFTRTLADPSTPCARPRFKA